MTRAERELRNAEIGFRALGGEAYVEIGRSYHLHGHTIYRIAKPFLIANGASRQQKKRVRDPEIIDMALAGKSYKRIAGKFDVSVKTVAMVARGAMRRMGIARKSRERWASVD